MKENQYICQLCPRNCRAERSETEGKGYCGMGTMPVIARAAPHYWEEPCISGTKGSGTIFFSGCVLGCVFCQNDKISHQKYGKRISPRQLAECFQRLEEQQVHNINLVSPTPFIEAILEAFSIYRPSIPVVYNTGGYEKPETLRRLEGVVDIYLPDLKYVRSDLSKKYSGAENYFSCAIAAIKEMVRQTGKPCIDENGIMQRGTIVRHLILPSHTKDSIQVLQQLKQSFGDSILVSLMGQYIPFGRANQYPEIARRITKREYEKVLSVLEDLELDGFCQELTSASKDYIPDFDIASL